MVYRTGRSARNDHQRPARNFRSTVVAPIVVDGELWGVMAVSHPHEVLARDTEERLEQFTAFVGPAIASAESRAELAQLADEQAALRQVATLVAQGARPEEVFSGGQQRGRTAVRRQSESPSPDTSPTGQRRSSSE